MALVAFAATGVALLPTFISASYDGRLDRDAARAPVFVDERADQDDVVARLHIRNEHLDFWYLHVFTVGVRDDTAPPPPGLPAWPEPGEVFASQALLDRPGAGAFVQRYGELAGVIHEEGLADPGERLVYVGAELDRMDPDRARPITGFGRDRLAATGTRFADTGYHGTVLYQQRRTNFYVELALFGITPLVVMAMVASRLAGEQRDRRIAVLTVLGADRWRRSRYLLRETWKPISIGAAAAVVAGAVATVGSWPLPLANYTVVGEDLRRSLWSLPLIAVGAGVATFLVVLVSHRVRRGAVFGTRPVPRLSRAPTWPLILLALVIPATYVGYMHFAHDRPDISSMIAVAGAGMSVLLVGSATAALLMALARATVVLAKRRSLPMLLVAGRDLATMSRPVIRATVAVSAAIVLATQIQVWVSMADASYRAASAQHALNQDRSLSVGVPDGSDVIRMVADLPDSVAALAVGTARPGGSDRPLDGTQVAWAPCDSLEQIRLECASVGQLSGATPRLAQVRHWLEPQARVIDATITDGPPDLAEDAFGEITIESIVLFATDGRPLSRDAVAEMALAYDPLQPRIEGPADSWLGGALVSRDQGRWFGYGGAIALTMIFLTAGFSLMFEMARVGRRFAPLNMLIGSPSPYYALAATVVGAPIVAAAATGLLVAVTIVLGPTSPGEGGQLPTSLLGALGGTAVVVAVVMSAVAGRATVRAARAWSAGRDP